MEKNMSCDLTLSEYLKKMDWKVEEMKVILERDSSSVNEKLACGSPLIEVLRNNKCSLEIVKLLLDYEANVNFHNKWESKPFCGSLPESLSPLLNALLYSRNEVIIKVLLEKGANVNAIDKCRRSSICYALHHGAPCSVVKLLLDAGCSLNTCKFHESALHCASDRPNSNIKAGVMELLIKAGLNVHRVDRNRQSVVCLALRAGAEVRDIKLLMKEGASLNPCPVHTSLLHCAIVPDSKITFKEDVVQFLLDKGACADIVNDQGCTPLQYALSACTYEVKAIMLLLNLPDAVNAEDQYKNTLLHFAVRNDHCKLSVVKYLIDKGVKLDKGNGLKNTPLFNAVFFECPANIVNFLIQQGSPINNTNVLGETPLQYLLCNKTEPPFFTVLQMLLNAGITQHHLYSALKSTLEQYDPISSTQERFKMLLKYYFLENWELDEGDTICRHWIYISELDFVNKCVEEVQAMSLQNIGCGTQYTLHEFLSQSSIKIAAGGIDYNFNQLLNVLSSNTFPIFFDVISSKIGKSTLKAKLLELHVQTVQKLLHSHCNERITFLDYDIIYQMVEYLSNDDILRMILAFYIPDNLAD